MTRTGSGRAARWRRTKSLVMWSGGLDSTYALVRVLEGSDDEVYAHHVRATTRSDEGRRPSARGDYEARAVESLRALLADRYRPFEYGESRIDIADLAQPAPETTVAAFFAAQVALGHGFTPFDRILLGASHDDGRAWQPDSVAFAFRRTVLLRTVRAVWESEEVPFVYLFNPRPTRQEEADALPLDLYAATASCRDPDPFETGLGELRYRPCGVCPQCSSRGRVVHRALVEAEVSAEGA